MLVGSYVFDFEIESLDQNRNVLLKASFRVVLTAQLKMQRWRAVLFDVDGTLYHQTRVRLIILRKMVAWSLSRPTIGYRTVNALRAYRRAQEKLRNSGQRHADLDKAQISEARRTANVSEEFLRTAVARWMQAEPLSTLVDARREGLIECLHRFKSHGISLGVVSDYPAALKLQSLGVENLFDVVVSAQDVDVGEFKPSPRGLLAAVKRLGVAAREAVYVGDRTDVDAQAARHAGMDCFIIGRTRSTCGSHHHCVSNFRDLTNTILGEHVAPHVCLPGTRT